jgi:hypothetical protein
MLMLSSKTTTTAHGKDWSPPLRLAQIMLIVYLTIPFMLLGLAVAVVPLLWATRRHEAWADAADPVVAAVRPPV